MAAKFFILAFVAILSTQALVEAQELPTPNLDKLKEILGRLNIYKVRECVKAEAQSFKDLYSEGVAEAKACAVKSDIGETVKALEKQYQDASVLIKSICSVIKSCLTIKCVERVVNTGGPKLSNLMNEAIATINNGKAAIKPEDKECFLKVRKDGGEKLKKINEKISECSG